MRNLSSVITVERVEASHRSVTGALTSDHECMRACACVVHVENKQKCTSVESSLARRSKKLLPKVAFQSEDIFVTPDSFKNVKFLYY